MPEIAIFPSQTESSDVESLNEDHNNTSKRVSLQSLTSQGDKTRTTDEMDDQTSTIGWKSVVSYFAIIVVGFTLLGLLIAFAQDKTVKTTTPLIEVFGDQKDAKFFAGDGICDDETNVAEYFFDGGDCCRLDCKQHVSTQATAFCNCKNCLCYSKDTYFVRLHSLLLHNAKSCNPSDVECLEVNCTRQNEFSLSFKSLGKSIRS